MLNINANNTRLAIGLTSLMFGASALGASNFVKKSFKQAYKDFNQSAYIKCNMPGLTHISSQFVKNEKIASTYSLAGRQFTVQVDINEDGDLSGSLKQRGLDVSAYVKKKWVYFNYFNLEGREKSQFLNQKMDKLGCLVKTAYSAPKTLNDEIVHINVHPHKRYDGLGVTTEGVNRYLNDRRLESIILLDFETKNYSARRWTSWMRTDYVNDVDAFMQDGGESIDFRVEYNASPIDLKRNNDIVVSQAGHNPYTITNRNQEIIYTGGNHNYCTSNNSKSLLRAAMKSTSNESITISYDLEATVVQQGSAKGIGLSFKDYSNRVSGIDLGAVLRDNPEFAQKYHERYLNNLIAYGIEKEGQNSLSEYYAEVIVRYESGSATYERVIEGTGRGTKRVNIKYIND